MFLMRTVSLILLTSLSVPAWAMRKLIIYHAGSLAVPFKEIAAAFEAQHPDVTVLREAAGSRNCARKIADLGKRCDVLASADCSVIDALLIPVHAAWNIKFASNEMVIVYSEKSHRADEMAPDNWYQILLHPEVAFGRSDPNADPCGYRAVLTMELAEQHYGKYKLAQRMLRKDMKYIRPKETDLLALLESRTIDYIFLYRSVAQQHGLPYQLLPDRINLKRPEQSGYYSQAAVEVSGKTPGSTITKRGAPMIYGVTIPNNAPSPNLAEEFVAFLLTAAKGMTIMERNGQPSMVPSPTETYEYIPDRLKQFARPAVKKLDPR